MTEPVGRPPKYKTPKAMQKDIDAYFEGDAYMGEGKHRVFAPTISGLAYALDMSRQALSDYENKDEFLDTVKKAKQKVEIALEQRLHGQAVVGTIFNLKNNFGWKDKQELDNTSSDGSMTPKGSTTIVFTPVNSKDG